VVLQTPANPVSPGTTTANPAPSRIQAAEPTSTLMVRTADALLVTTSSITHAVPAQLAQLSMVNNAPTPSTPPSAPTHTRFTMADHALVFRDTISQTTTLASPAPLNTNGQEFRARQPETAVPEDHPSSTPGPSTSQLGEDDCLLRIEFILYVV
jgi:hypothetical protein